MTGSNIQNAVEHLQRGERLKTRYRNGAAKNNESYQLADLEYSAGTLEALISIATGIKRLNDRLDDNDLHADFKRFEEETST